MQPKLVMSYYITPIDAKTRQPIIVFAGLMGKEEVMVKTGRTNYYQAIVRESLEDATTRLDDLNKWFEDTYYHDTETEFGGVFTIVEGEQPPLFPDAADLPGYTD